MNMERKIDVPISDYEPDRWYVCFFENSENKWVNFFAFGRFKHVSAFGWVESAGVWLFYDHFMHRTRMLAVSDADFRGVMHSIVGNAAIVTMPKSDFENSKPRFSIGLSCVTGVAHLLALRTCALRPDALFAHCLKHGGQMMKDAGDNGNIENSKRIAGDSAPA